MIGELQINNASVRFGKKKIGIDISKKLKRIGSKVKHISKKVKTIGSELKHFSQKLKSIGSELKHFSQKLKSI
ncbi:hypothetical protein D0X99_15335 [Algoriphagus lacus]|uniref:Uncharacterized protein n=1 Tax=Algoriphagus lacus TaxID=2056311 RepID=A0A418PNP0_9BACT|nr:hypothetical protein D0X99_15335 [Algoriphagus lacus]